MPYRLGLDLGTSSCGLLALRLGEKGNPDEAVLGSVDIFSEPLLPPKQGGVGEPKKSARRQARQQSRQIDRRARRYRGIAYLAPHLGIDPENIPPDPGQHIHKLRAQAANGRIELADFFIVLMKLAKRRGYAGSFRVKKPDDKDAGTVEPGIQNLKKAMLAEQKKLGSQKPLTLGEYLNARFEAGKHLRLKDDGLYASRMMVVEEFEHIWKTQEEHHAVLNQSVDGSPLKNIFRQAIFFQRPLKSPSPMVGHCPLEPSLPRAPWAQMAAQCFRIEKQISDLRWGIGRSAQFLSSEQKSIIRGLLEKQKEVSFSTIIKAFAKHSAEGPQGIGLNIHRASRESLKGNTTLAAFRALGLEDQWRDLAERTQIQVVNFLADLGSPDALDDDNWPNAFSRTQRDKTTGRDRQVQREFDSNMVDFINLMRSHQKFGRLTSMGFDGGRAGYCIKALSKLIPLLEEGWHEREAIEQAYPGHFDKQEICDELPLPPETGNVVVDVALRQVYRAVRRAIDQLGEPPSQIVVELSRDMALGLGKRGEIENRINANQRDRKKAAKEIEDHDATPSQRNIHRYLLWESQAHHCPYCKKRMSLGDALSSDTEREHILPRSLTRVGGKRNQLVLAHRACNQEKGNNTPWQAFGADPERWQIIEDNAALFAKDKKMRGKARLLLLTDWENEVLDDATIKGFSDRQFQESSWIAKKAAHWLRAICTDVAVSRGGITAHLRKIWGLDTVIARVRYESGLPVLDTDGKAITQDEFEHYRGWWEGHSRDQGAQHTDRRIEKRIDHRHHLIDALVVGMTSRSLYKKMARNYKAENEKAMEGRRANFSLHVEPPIRGIRKLALELARECEPWHKPDRHPDGAIFQGTAYGLSKEVDENGQHKLAVRIFVKDIAGPSNSADVARKSIAGIESSITRDAVLAEFDKRLAGGQSVKEALSKPILHPENGTPIRRVRVLRDSESTAAEIVHQDRQGVEHHKHLVHAGNAYLEIKVEDGKLIGSPRLVPIQQAMKEKHSRPPEGVRRFWKGDTIKNCQDNSLYLVRQIKAQGGGMLVMTPATEAREVRDMKASDGLKKISGKGLAIFTIETRNV